MTHNESTLGSVTRNLKSTKAKERQEGLTSLQEVFSQDRVIDNLSKSEPKAWLSVFRALYRCVAEEKEAAVKKSKSKSSSVSATAFRKLEHAAGVVRWLTERTVRLLNKEVIKELFMHLTQTMIYCGALFTPVALDYIHAMTCLASYTPHLEHMADDTWVKIVEMGFNVILDDPIQQEFADEEATANDIDSDMYIDDAPDDDDDDDLPATVMPGSKKRSRYDQSAPPSTNLSKQDKFKSGQTIIAPSREQLVFALLLSILIGSPAAPILSLEFPNLSSGMLLRLQRFLKRFPTDSSLLHSFLAILLSTLKHLSLNRRNEVQNFARSSWNGLLSLWGQKDKSMKGSLTAVLRVLFPFLIAPSNMDHAPSFDCADALGRLWQLLDGEAESRWGADRLTLDALRFELLDPTDPGSHNGADRAFIAQTFRAGWDFNAGQALSWAILELKADCAGKLYQLSESIHSTATPGSSRSHAKRTKLENPISSLLHSIHAQPSSNTRCYHLQTLLFFIERYWSYVHYSFKEEVINVLLQHVTSDDGIVQSWIFLNLAAIAYDEGFAKPSSNKIDSPMLTSTIWDPIWTHAIRRANVPNVCRSACHAGHTFLVSLYNQTDLSRILLTSHHVLLEIETLAKDMDVQGPAYPYDSVCMFLSQCLSIASQDVRLYRMQLEDKVLSWLIDSWKMSGTERTKVSLHGIKDIFILLETVCGLTKRVELPEHLLLPRCQIVDSVIEEQEGKVIRDFLLYAKLPSFQQKPNTARNTSTTDSQAASITDLQLLTARGRERKISAFFLKSLESLLLEWEALQDNLTAEMSRRMLDLAIAAITFETLLMFNGTASNRQVLQRAAKVISTVIPLLNENRWTVAEKSLVLSALESIIHHAGRSQGRRNWEALSWPGTKSGIQEKILSSLTPDRISCQDSCSTRRISFLRLIWQTAEVQETLTSVINILREVLRRMLVDPSSISNAHRATDVDDKDGFGPIRTTPVHGSSRTTQTVEDGQPAQQLLQICISFLTCGPFLQSASGEPTRDKELIEIILECAENQPARFGMVCPILLNQIRHGFLNLHLKHLDSFLNQMSDLLKQYQFSRSERILQLVIDLLDSTLSIWLTPQAQSNDVGEMVGELCAWLAKALRKQKISTWTLRDGLAQFLDRYLSLDPSQTYWSTTTEEDLPTALLPMMTADHDIRVRFRVAVLNTRLFDLEVHTGQSPTTMYTLVQKWYTVNLEKYEHMLTRMLSLGNIMIVSSAVRRGPYWHLLEACLYSNLYSSHIEAILTGVSQRLGMTSLSVLFEAYSSQLAYSIRQTEADFFRFPPHLLGYLDRKQCAEATFRAFAPTNILANGEKLFENHCRVLQKSTVDGLRDCFGDIVGVQIGTWMDENRDGSVELGHLLKERMALISDFDLVLQQNVDSVAATILRALGDQDYSDDGPITEALRKCDETGEFALTFQALTRYRKFDPLVIHKPNLPAFSTQNILHSWFWFSLQLPDASTKATTYHVLHQLFADLQSTPLVNEQNRLINAISVWIAIRHKDFNDITLLHTVTHGASLFFAQTDLARSAQSILEWAFRRYRKTRIKDARIPNILIRLSCIAHDYANNSPDQSTSNMGNEMLGWIDDQVYLLTKVTVEIGDLIYRALLAWPHQPSPQLLEAYNDITLNSLASVLSDHGITSNKFRLVRRLRDRALAGDYSEMQYSKTDFWRLKECMPSTECLQDEDVEAFAALLTLNHGKIGSFNIEQPNINSLRPRHRHNVTKKSLADGTIAARDAITLTLLGMLEDDSPSHVSNAYNTLRLIMSVSTAQDLQAHMPSDYYRVELDYLRIYWRSPNSRPSRNLADELKSDLCFDNFSRWISTITVLLADLLGTVDPFFAQLNSILTSDLAFAEQILPVLVHTLLQAEKGSEITSLSFRPLLSSSFTSVLSAKNPDISCVRAIVDIVLHLRYFSPGTNDALGCNKWLDIDYTLLAQSAVLCGAYTTALLFLELASEPNAQSVIQNPSTEQVLYEIYAHIDEPDGFYGIKSNDLQQFLVRRFHHEKQWEKAFRFHGAALEAGRECNGEEEGLLKAFHFFGFDHLAIDTLQNSRGNSFRSPSASMSYRLGWRTETWDLPDRVENAANVPLYKSLRAIYRERDPRVLDGIIRASLFAEMARMRSLGSENLAEIREAAQDLMCLNQVSQWRQDFIQKRLETRSFNSGDWDGFVNIGSGFDFSDLEALTATRISLVRSVRQREERHQIGTIVTPFVASLIDIERKCLLCLSRAARASNQVQIALNSVVRAQRLTMKPSSEVSEEFANVLWLQKEEKLAVQFLRDLVDNSANFQSADMSRKAMWLARLGTWTSDACLEKPADIWTRYFNPSISLLDEARDDKQDLLASRAAVYRECAMFTERQYHATLKSPDGIRWKVYVDRKKQEIERRSMELARTSHDSARKELELDQARAQKLLQEDSELFRKHNTIRDNFLRQAIDMYSRCLEASGDFDDDSAIRFCSLWFANFDDESALETVKDALEHIPSRKLVFLAHQLTARLATQMSKTQNNLQRLIMRMCREHPFHSLYQVYCLQPDHPNITTANRRQGGRHSTLSTQTERGAAAKSIFDRLRGDESVENRVRDVERLCDACLEWAKYPIAKDPRYKKSKSSRFKIPDNLSIRKVTQLKVPVTTAHTPLDLTMKYKDCVWIDHYEPIFSTAGGINLPKVSICHGSDGQKYKQLFKGEGNDDLRQDAVMEQVFDLVNSILRRDQETRQRDLKVREYKIIPLSPRAGLLEFVGNTFPLREWLSKAHLLYHPTDLKSHEILNRMKGIQEVHRREPDKQLSFFLEVRQQFRPVMRHYFTEIHKTPISWFSMRLNYTRSVATTSIVGHVLGIGDRHISNILLDNVTGEIIHIDFGIAFDQGKLLTVPERVPFRMTADIVDGMGTSGTSGVFQRCAEETLRVLREESDVIMTVLEVFKYDPLHSWTASEVKVKQAQSDVPTATATATAMNDTSRFNLGIGIDMSSGSADEAADRALSSVARKLDRSLSVESTVNELLAEATDPLNLATIFYGWSPWM